MTKDEIIAKLKSMAKYPTVTLPRDTEALRLAASLLEQSTEQEPVAWMDIDGNIDCGLDAILNPDGYRPLYTTPPQRTWVGLTDEEIFEIHKQVDSMQYLTFGQAIEAKLKEKNT